MNLEEVVKKAVSEGKKFRREGWVEGKLFVFHKQDSVIDNQELHNEEYINALGDIETEKITLSGHLDMVVEDENGEIAVLVGWHPEGKDVYADDYVIVD
jgi:hypothetical protein